MKRTTNNTNKEQFGWHDIDWVKVNRKVFQQQVRIGVAYNNNNIGLVRQLQDNLVRSWRARALAVKTITTNKGKNTPGIDKIVWNTPEAKFAAIPLLLVDPNNYQCQKIKRVYIPKAKGGLRPLGIPCMIDCRLQSVWKLALDPCREYNGDQHSYGFRKGRSTKDAQTMLHLLFGSKYRPTWRIDADIKGFFDNISHDWLLQHIPMDKRILKSWLKAGALDLVKIEDIETTAGVPQGGPISPIIANMTLDGLEGHVKAAVAHLHNEKQRSKYKKKTFSPKVNVIRYRDDFIITASSKRIINDLVKPRVSTFLRSRGLSLNENKTVTMPIKKGLDFLGYNFRIYPYQKRQTKYIRLTKPSKAGVKRLLANCKTVFKTTLDAGAIVYKLNPKLRGWANYYNGCTAKRTFSTIGWRLWYMALKWASKKHSTSGKRILVQQYFKKVGGRTWVFYGKYNDKDLLLFDIRNTPIIRHAIIIDKNPYKREDIEYFNKRRLKVAKSFIAWDKRRLKFVKKQKFTCPVCGELLFPQQPIELHHILAKSLGGSDKDTYLVALHKQCHVQVTHTNNPELLARFKRKGVLK